MTAIIVTGGKRYKGGQRRYPCSSEAARRGRRLRDLRPGLAVIDGETATFSAPGGRCKGGSQRRQERQGQENPYLQVQAQKGYRKRQGHRQPYTKVTIGKIVVA